jgi:hypothetical protein
VTAVIVDGNGLVAAWSSVTGGVEDEDEDEGEGMRCSDRG